MLFGLILFLNINTSDATTTNISVNKELPKVTSVDPANHSIIPKSKGIKVKFNESVKFGTNYIELRNIHGNVPIKKIINSKTLYIIPKNPLSSGFKYNLVIHTGSLVSLSGKNVAKYSTSFTVSPITLTQMKDGISRAEIFYQKNSRLPKTIRYGANKIPIKEFKQIIATQNLKIKTTSHAKLSYSIPKSSNGCTAYNITITSQKVSATSKCSCGACGDYNYHTSTYKNYCPNCHKYGTLVWNPKGVLEGEWTCSSCDCDYCAACGKEKIYSSPKYLIKA